MKPPRRVIDVDHEALGLGVTALIDSYDAAWNAQDLDAIAGMHDDSIIFHNHTAGERVEGAAAVRAHIDAIFTRWPTLRFERRSLRCGGDFAVSEWTARAVHQPSGGWNHPRPIRRQVAIDGASTRSPDASRRPPRSKLLRSMPEKRRR